MDYIIRPAYVGGPPSDKQRTHPKFTEEPVIGAFHVRRGSFIRLDEGQYAAAKHQIDTLLEADAIIVTREGEPAPVQQASMEGTKLPEDLSIPVTPIAGQAWPDPVQVAEQAAADEAAKAAEATTDAPSDVTTTEVPVARAPKKKK
jgi:hypothetical protein